VGAYSAAIGRLAGLGGSERDTTEMERGGKGRRKGEGRERNRKEGANEKAWKGDQLQI